MSKTIVQWGFIGFGQIARDRMAPALTQTPNARLVGIYDLSETIRQNASAEYHCQSYSSFTELLADPEIQVVYIATPNALHYEQTLAAARAGKHVLCEKPMALKTAQCEEMIRVCQENGVRLGVGYMGRFNAYNVKAKALLAERKIGAVKCVRANFSFINQNRGQWRFDPAISGGGPILDVGVHLINLLRFFLPARVCQVSATGVSIGTGIELTSAALLKLTDDTICSLDCSYELPASQSVEIVGTDGQLSISGSLFQSPHGRLIVHTESGDEDIAVNESDPYRMELVEMSETVRSGGEMCIEGSEGLEDMRIAEAWIKSMSTGDRESI